MVLPLKDDWEEEWVDENGVVLAKPKTKFDDFTEENTHVKACTTDSDCPDKTTTDKDGKEKVHKYSCGKITRTTGKYKSKKHEAWHNKRVMDLPEQEFEADENGV